MAADIEVRQVTTRGERAVFVKFPWRVYRGDHNWVPPLISEQLEYLNPQKNRFFNQAEVALLVAHRDGEIVGTIAPFIDHYVIEHTGEQAGGFGFFEVIPDYEVAKALFDAACEWQRTRNIPSSAAQPTSPITTAPGCLSMELTARP